MKYVLFILVIASVAWFSSCTKTVNIEHDVHDTLYLTQIKVDTFHSIVIRTDTLIKQDNNTDTVIQVKHDTIIVTKITTDTLFKTLFDSIYLTKTTHDTVTKIQYSTDTVNNYITVLKYDTILKINTVTVTDTLYQYVNPAGYPVPATDSQFLFIYFDTIPGLVIHSLTFTNINSWIPVSPYKPGQGQYTQIFTCSPQYDLSEGWFVRVPTPMICNISIDYDWTAPGPVHFILNTFNLGPGIPSSWETSSPGGLGGSPGSVFHDYVAQFNYINLPVIGQLTIQNH
jgi:hypothetical protein